MQLFLFLALIFAIIFLFFIGQNSYEVTVKFAKWEFSRSISFIVGVAFSAGIFTGMLLFIPAWWKKMVAGRAQKKRIGELEKELLTDTGPQEAPETAEIEEQL